MLCVFRENNSFPIFFILSLIFLQTSLQAQSGSPVCINEFLAYNVSVNAEMTDFDDFSDWVELYNRSDSTLDLSNYSITDDLSDPRKWVFPAGTQIESSQYLLLWADGYDDVPGRTYQRPYFPNNYFTTRNYHLNFALSKSGEALALFNAQGELLDSVSFSIQEKDVSLGRVPEADSLWRFYGQPTPGQANTGPYVIHPVYAPQVQFSHQGGFFASPQSVTLSSGGANDTIRFTLDNSKPDRGSAVFSSPLLIGSTTTIRARVYRSGHLPGPAATQTFFINETATDLSVVSLICDPEWLWDQQTGIYDNQYKEREIPVYFEFYENMESRAVHQDAGLRLTGEYSYLFPQKPLTIYARRRYGNDEINYPVFPELDIQSFKMLYLRNGGYPDAYHTLMRDVFQHSLMAGSMDIDYQAYRPVAVYLNGEYWGVYNLREKINEHFITSRHGVDPDHLDILEYQYSPVPDEVRGTRDDYTSLLQFIAQNDMSDSLNYAHVCSQIDIDAYLNYMVAEIYCDNTAWLDINTKWWREQVPGSRWRWIFFDLDHAYGLPQDPYITTGYRHNTLRFATSSLPPGSLNPPTWSTLLFRRLLENETFQNLFIQKFSSLLNTAFEPGPVEVLLDSLRQRIESEMSRHINRWRDAPATPYYTPLTNIALWQQNVDLLYTFARNRPVYQRQHIDQYFELDGTSTINVFIDPPGSGRIRVNKTELHDTSFSGEYFNTVPLELHAKARPGFRFNRWQGLPSGAADSTVIQVRGDSVLTAYFEAEVSNTLAGHISSDTVLASAASPYFITQDVMIDSGITLRIEPGTRIFLAERVNIYVYGALIAAGTEADQVVLASDPASGWENWGALCFINSTDTSMLSHAQISGASRGKTLPRDKGAISAFNSSLILTGVQLQDVQFPVFIQNSTVEIRDCYIHTAVSSDYINIKNSAAVLIQNCTFPGNNAFDTDAIDLDQVSAARIRGNIISNFRGVNSDGIDLGENCTDILIENNTILNCTDKGVSVGQGSTVTLRRNLIAGCAQGIGIKDDGSFAYADRNTFYANVTGVACFEKIFGEGGGSATVVNSIFSRSSGRAVFADHLSILQVSYSLSDTDALPGQFNLNSDPLFVNNLRLSENSPCIDSGDPVSPNDPDGSRADMGAYFYDPQNDSHLLINEIHYNPAGGINFEFIELYNGGSGPLDLSGYRLEGPVMHTFESGSINPGSYLVLAKNSNTYSHLPGGATQWDSGELPQSVTTILLKTNEGTLLDAVTYGTADRWASAANGNGPSLELREQGLENLLAANWRASYAAGGSPGAPNHMPLVTDLYINEFLASNGTVNHDENGDYDDWIELYNGGERSVDISGFYLTDNNSDATMWRIPVRNPDSTTMAPGSFLLLWADNEPAQGLFHLAFRLARTGESIALVQISGSDTHFVDSLSFEVQTRDISFGRDPDGVDSWQYFNTPTPGRSNIISSLTPGMEILPDNYELEQNYPNPFNPVTTIRFALPQPGHVEIILYNITGQKVAILTDGVYTAGYHNLAVKAGNLSSGIYIYRIRAGKYVNSKKMLLLR